MTDDINSTEKNSIEKPRRISELVEGEKIFESNGYALVKITKDGKEIPTELPIRSTGVAEYMRDLEGKAPKPPVKKVLIKKNSSEGKELGLPHDKYVQILDTADENYIDSLNKHNQEFVWRVAIFALDIKWIKLDGSEAKSFEEKKQVLATNDITWSQIYRIFHDVKNLTEFAEDREDFLSDN